MILLLAAAAFIVAAVAATIVWVSLLPVSTSIDGVSADLSPDTAVEITMPSLGVTISDTVLLETARDQMGETRSEQLIPVRLIPIQNGADSDPLASTMKLERVDGARLLNYDGEYHLRLSVARLAARVPFLSQSSTTRDYIFRTQTTPRLEAPAGVIELGYHQPLMLHFTAPVASFAVDVTPGMEAPTRVDPAHPDTGYVDLNAAPPGTVLRVLVKKARGTNNAPLLSPAAVTVETAAPPRPLTELASLEDGTRIVIPWDQPLMSLDYEVDPPVKSVLQIDESDRRISYILLQNPDQKQEYRVRMVGGIGVSGAPVIGTPEFTFVTPAPLQISEISPGDGYYGVQLDSTISVRFSEPVGDRRAAEESITIDPSVPGHFEWPQPDLAHFVPQDGLPESTDLTVHIQGGPGGVRGASGGYLEDSMEFGFLTRPNKLIDVDLTNQRLVLYDGGEPVFATPASTGVRGAETPTGDFMVDYKLATTRMRGVNPGGSRYDIPNVPWVMSFLGDYTIHGAPWRSQFGFPQSNGCVSLATNAAKIVFDWAPVGTPVHIHY